MNIISASRRTDIPAFYMPWLIDRMRAGLVKYPNPRTGQSYTISLMPEEVHSFVFWSKDYRPFLSHLREVTDRGYRFYCHYSVTGVPGSLEPRVPDWRSSVETFRELAARTSPRHVLWRFDPILFADEFRAEHCLARFRDIATALVGTTRRCYFSFAVFYGKVRRKLEKAGVRFSDPSLEEKRALLEGMAGIADECGIVLHSCCDDALVGTRVRKAHCVDGDLLAELFPDRPRISLCKPTRKGCGCTASRDIGVYDTCPHGCLYCYANHSGERPLGRLQHQSSTGE